MSLERKIAVIGLGYVGLTIAMAFSRKNPIIGYDPNLQRLEELKHGKDWNHEVSPSQLKAANITYTHEPTLLKQANFYIVTVPTPLSKSNEPDLSILCEATHTLSQVLKKGDIVVYESTVYPGVTEEICIPILEKGAQLTCGADFGVGYSPERINPGDKNHTFYSIKKIVSAINPTILAEVAEIYGEVITGGIHTTSSIKIAEAAKIIENTQRDVNIALMNEITQICHKTDLSLEEIMAAMQTKWNALPFRPGLVGGHCIGINSHYLAYKAQTLGYYPNMILSALRTNESMPAYIVQEMLKAFIPLNIAPENARVGILGLSYKENYPDFHDSKIFHLIELLENQKIHALVHDPIINYELAKKSHHLNLKNWQELTKLDALLICVAHDAYKELDGASIKHMLNPHALVMDIKGVLPPHLHFEQNIHLWRM